MQIQFFVMYHDLSRAVLKYSVLGEASNMSLGIIYVIFSELLARIELLILHYFFITTLMLEMFLCIKLMP